jgi:hypothetical protein
MEEKTTKELWADYEEAMALSKHSYTVTAGGVLVQEKRMREGRRWVRVNLQQNYSSIIKIKAAHSSETLAPTYHSTRRHIQENINLCCRSCENPANKAYR